MNFKCPNCNHLIDKKDFNNIDLYFSQSQEVYKKELDQKLLKEKQKYLEEKMILQEKIKELELANNLNRVIQNKVKGENFEKEVEKILRDSFEPNDIISKITYGGKKADFLHMVRLDDKKEIGKIVYEVKNAEWKDTWENKLIKDMAKENAKYGILIATSFNKKYAGISFRISQEHPNIYLVSHENFVAIGQLVKTMIKKEYKIEKQYDKYNQVEMLEALKKWRDVQLPLINSIIQENLERIEQSEHTISNQLNEIRIGREKISSSWLYKVKDFIDNL